MAQKKAEVIASAFLINMFVLYLKENNSTVNTNAANGAISAPAPLSP
jgi:hypothetical protein